MSHRVFRLLCGLVPLLALACASGPLRAPAPEPVAAGGVAPRRVMVAPLNLAIALPEELADATLPVETELLRALTARGLRVSVIEPGDAWALWRSAVAGVPQDGTPARRLEAAIRAFAASLREAGAAFDHLLLPALAYRTAKVDGLRVRWDGVTRRLQLEVRGAADAPAYDPDWREVPGLSLHLTIVDAEGRVVGRRWGGLDLVQSAVVGGAAREGPTLVLRRDILQDPERVREGVGVALEGYAEAPAAAETPRGGRAAD